MGPDDDNVSRLLSTLNRVEAPNDFDFRVKARIAAGRPAARRPFGLPAAVGYAIPLVLVMLIVVYFGFNALNANKTVNEPIVAGAPKVSSAPLTASPSNAEAIAHPITEERADGKKQELPVGQSGDNWAKKSPNKVSPSTRPGGGSMDEIQGVAPPPLRPRGFNTNLRPPSNSSGMDRTAPVQAQTFLNVFGMNGAFGDAGWKVESVTPDSLAARSGVKTGDVIEAMNDQALTEKTTFNGKYNAKSLRVRRDGTSIQIILKN